MVKELKQCWSLYQLISSWYAIISQLSAALDLIQGQSTPFTTNQAFILKTATGSDIITNHLDETTTLTPDVIIQ